MHGSRSATTTGWRLACLVITALLQGRLAAGRAAEPGDHGSAGGEVRRLVATLGYAPEAGDQFAAFAHGLPVERWRARLRTAAARGPHGSPSAAGVAAELAVTEEIRRKLDAIVRQVDGGSTYWNLPAVLADRRAQCLGNCQLWYVLGNAVGLRTAAVEVSRPPEGELGEHETHVATLIRLADGRTRMIDTRFGIDSEPFRFAEVYRRDGAWWNRADLAGDRSLHRRVRPLDAAGIEAAILLNIGNTYRRSGHEAEAAPIYERALAADPDSPALHLAVAETCFRNGTWDGADRSIRAAIELDPQGSDGHEALGRLRMRQNRWAEAIAAFDQAIVLKPHSPDAITARQEALNRRGEGGP